MTPLTLVLIQRTDGTIGLADADGRPIARDARVDAMSAGDLETALLQARQAGIEAAARVGAEVVALAIEKGRAAGVKAGADAGVKAGMEYAIATTRVKRTVERDGKGQITGTIEERVPVPAADAPKRKPMGFGR